jgi:hypothetical protein
MSNLVSLQHGDTAHSLIGTTTLVAARGSGGRGEPLLSLSILHICADL